MKVKPAWVVSTDDGCDHTIIKNYRQPVFCLSCQKSYCPGIAGLEQRLEMLKASRAKVR